MGATCEVNMTAVRLAPTPGMTKAEFVNHVLRRVEAFIQQPKVIRKRKPGAQAAPWIYVFDGDAGGVKWDPTTMKVLDANDQPVNVTEVARIFCPGCLVTQNIQTPEINDQLYFVTLAVGLRVIVACNCGWLPLACDDGTTFRACLEEMFGVEVMPVDQVTIDNADTVTDDYEVIIGQYKYVCWGTALKAVQGTSYKYSTAQSRVAISFSHPLLASSVDVATPKSYGFNNYKFGAENLKRFPADLAVGNAEDVCWTREALVIGKCYAQALANPRFTEIDSRLDGIDTQLQSHQRDIEVAANGLFNLDTQLDGTIKPDIATLKQDVSGLKLVDASHTNDVALLTTTCENLRLDVDNNASDVETLRQDLDASGVKIDDNTVKIAAAVAAAAGVSALVATLVTRMDKVESDIASQDDDDTYMPW